MGRAYPARRAAIGTAPQPLGHLEVALRNAMGTALADRQRRNGLAGSWLDDLGRVLDSRARTDIAVARRRVRRKGKRPSDGPPTCCSSPAISTHSCRRGSRATAAFRC